MSSLDPSSIDTNTYDADRESAENDIYNPNAKTEQPQLIADEKKSDDLETRVYYIFMDDPEYAYEDEYFTRIINKGKTLMVGIMKRDKYGPLGLYPTTIFTESFDIYIEEEDELAITEFKISTNRLTLEVYVSFKRCPQTKLQNNVHTLYSQILNKSSIKFRSVF